MDMQMGHFLATIAAGPILAGAIGSYPVTIGDFRFDVTGSAVNRMPAASAETICCTTTAMWTFR